MTTAQFDTLYYDHIEGVIADPVVMVPDSTANRVLELDRELDGRGELETYVECAEFTSR